MPAWSLFLLLKSVFSPGIYDDDLEIVTLDSGDFGENPFLIGCFRVSYEEKAALHDVTSLFPPCLELLDFSLFQYIGNIGWSDLSVSH